MAILIVHCAAAAAARAAICTNAWLSWANPPVTEAAALLLALSLLVEDEGAGVESEVFDASDEEEGTTLEDGAELELGTAELLDAELEDGVHVDDGVELVVGGGVDVVVGVFFVLVVVGVHVVVGVEVVVGGGGE